MIELEQMIGTKGVISATYEFDTIEQAIKYWEFHGKGNGKAVYLIKKLFLWRRKRVNIRTVIRRGYL